MKIVIVGSAHSVHIRKIADNLVGSGHQVSVFSEESSLTESSPQTYASNVTLFDTWPTGKVARKISFLLKLNLYLLRTNADIVWFIYASSYGCLTPKVFTFAKKVVSVWGSDILINSYKKAYGAKISRSLDKADLIFSTSEFLRTHTRRLTSSKIILTPYGPNDAFFEKPSGPQIDSTNSFESTELAKTYERVIVCTKWLKAVYGVDILIRAVALDPSYFRNKGIGVLICGDGQDAAAFREIVRLEDLDDIVKFVGYQTESQVIRLLEHVDLAVFPSRSESFGVSLLECFSRKVPVVCSNAGGFNELSQGGRFGHVIASLEPSDYLVSIKKVLDEGPLYDLSEAQEFSASFAWSNCMAHMESALADLLTASPKSNCGAKDFRLDESLDSAVFIHGEPRVVDSHLTRAREIRISGFRQALTRQYRLQELFAGSVTARDYEKMVRSVFDVAGPKLVYIEGSSSMLNSFSRRYKELRSVLKVARNRKISLVYYLPDAHEYWDDYIISTRSATNLHLARHRKRKLLKLLMKFNAIIAYPSGEFRSALIDKIEPNIKQKLQNSRFLVLPPAASNSMQVPEVSKQELTYVYAGGICPFYKLHRLLLALIQSQEQIKALLYIRQRDVSALESKYAQLLHDANLDIRHGSLPEVIPDTLPVGLLVLEPIDYISVAIPLKFYSYLERGWPILCFSNTAVGNLVEEHNLGWVIEPKVDALTEFFVSELPLSDYATIQASIAEYIVSNQWANRVEKIAEVTK